MGSFSSIDEVRETRAVKLQLLDTLEIVKSITASENSRAALGDRINALAETIRNFDSVIQAWESELVH